MCPKCAGVAAGNLPVVDDSIRLEAVTIEEVKSFCYFGDVLQSEGGVERAVRARVSQAWMKWREISALLCNRNVPIRRRSIVYQACIRSVMLYAAETWALTQRLEKVIQSCDRRMLRRMWGISLRDRMHSEKY